MGFPNNLSFVHEDQMYEGSSHFIGLTGMKSTGRNGRESRDMDSTSEGCEFKSGKELEIDSNTKLLATVSF